MLNVFILIYLYEKRESSYHFLPNVNLKKYILWLQVDAQPTAFDYITTRGTKAHPIQDWLPGEINLGPVPWSPDPSSKHSFNRGGRVSGLGKTSRNVHTENVNRYPPFPYWESFKCVCWNVLPNNLLGFSVVKGTYDFIRCLALKNTVDFDDFCAANQANRSRPNIIATAWLLITLPSEEQEFLS